MTDIKRAASMTLGAVLVAALAACASPYQQGGGYSQGGQGGYSQSSGGYAQGVGTVTNVQLVRGQGGSGLTGAVVGGAVGGLAGHEIAGRGDKLLGTVVGGVAGAFGGQAIDRTITAKRRCRR